ncbi:MAG: DUF565 domain-containing protein [Vulcanococcus sp.]
MPLQATRFDRLQRRGTQVVFGAFQGSWRRRSSAVLALLLGFYAGQNATAWWLNAIGQRPLVVLVLVLLLELVIRLRTRLVGEPVSLAWVLIDNVRLGLVYAVVLEAFKLGS